MFTKRTERRPPPISTCVVASSAATTRSPSEIGLAIHSPSRSRNAPEMAVTSPPAPRRATRSPEGVRSYVTGPRLETTTRGVSTALGQGLEQREMVVEVARRQEPFLHVRARDTAHLVRFLFVAEEIEDALRAAFDVVH